MWTYLKCITIPERLPLEQPRSLIYDSDLNSKMIVTSLPIPPAPLDEVELPEPGQTFVPGTALKTVKFVV
jgi:hypothetical protein